MVLSTPRALGAGAGSAEGLWDPSEVLGLGVSWPALHVASRDKRDLSVGWAGPG